MTTKPLTRDTPRTERAEASLELLYAISRELSAQLDLDELLKRVLSLTMEYVGAQTGSILVLDEDQRVIEGAVAYGGEIHQHPTDRLVDTFDRGLAGWVVDNRKAVLVENTREDPRWLQRPNNQTSDLTPRAAISVPLVARDRVVGAVTLVHPESRRYTQDHLDLVTAIADSAGVAIENARLYDESRRQLYAMVSLAETARVVTASLDIDDVLMGILNQTTETLEVEAASLALIDEPTGELEFKVAIGEGAEGVIGYRLPKGEGIAGWVAENDKPQIVADVKTDERFFSGVDQSTGFETRTIICVPIKVQNKVIGILEAINPKSGRLIPEHVDLLQGIAGLAGTAINHAQLFAQTQMARERYASLFEDSFDPILITDLSGQITDANHQAILFLGRPEEELIGLDVLALHVPDEADTIDFNLDGLDPGETITYTGKATHRNGHALPAEVRVKRIDLENGPFLQWILSDISERVELDELREDLTSMIFHDLRSPLGNVISSLEVLKGSMPANDETAQSVLAIALRSSRRLGRLVESLLDLGQLEAGKAVLHKESASLGAIITDAVEEVLPVAEAKGHMLRFKLDQELPEVEIDVEMIRRVIINLLENAIKYTPAGGRILISASKERAALKVSVRDSGPGIPEEDSQKIFDKFSRIHGPGRPKGLGLGLAFCRLAVEEHRGSIWVESNEGQGSAFSFLLPL